MKIVKHIVFTGPPCGGKTKSMREMRKMLVDNGWKVFTLSEIATFMIKTDITPLTVGRVAFQKSIMMTQIKYEDTMNEIANNIDNEKVVILQDRGIMDNRVYLSDEEYEQLLKESNLTELDVINRYDAVINLENAQVFEKKSNKYRIEEDLDEAKELSERSLKTMQEHPGFHYIKYYPTYDEKRKELESIVQNIVKN